MIQEGMGKPPFLLPGGLVGGDGGHGLADSLDHGFWRLEELLPGEVDNLIARVAEVAVPFELVNRVPPVLVLEEAVGLDDNLLPGPEEIHAEGAVGGEDRGLELRRVQSELGKDYAGDRLKGGLGTLVGA